jgi:hypothetical protein
MMAIFPRMKTVASKDPAIFQARKVPKKNGTKPTEWNESLERTNHACILNLIS